MRNILYRGNCGFSWEIVDKYIDQNYETKLHMVSTKFLMKIIIIRKVLKI